jgi:hypothetical protein
MINQLLVAILNDSGTNNYVLRAELLLLSKCKTRRPFLPPDNNESQQADRKQSPADNYVLTSRSAKYPDCLQPAKRWTLWTLWTQWTTTPARPPSILSILSIVADSNNDYHWVTGYGPVIGHSSPLSSAATLPGIMVWNLRSH